MSKKYKAFIDEFDDDYRAFVGTKTYLVDNKKEAERLAKSMTDRPRTFVVSFLIENKE